MIQSTHFVQRCCGLVLAGWLFASAAPAQARSEDPEIFQLTRRIDKADINQMYDRLELTPQQRSQLERNRQQYHSRIKDLTRRIDDLKAQIKQELEKATLDQNKVSRLQFELNQAQSELSNLRVQGIMGVRDILTPDQYRTFNRLTQ